MFCVIPTLNSIQTVAVYRSDGLFCVSYKLNFNIVFRWMLHVLMSWLGRLVTAQDWDRCQASPFGIYGVQSGTGKGLLLLFRFHHVTLPVLLTCRHVNITFIWRTSGRILGTSKRSRGVSDLGGRVDNRSTVMLFFRLLKHLLYATKHAIDLVTWHAGL